MSMSFLDILVPVVADNTYNGHPTVIWALWLITAYNIWRSLTHWLKYDGGAQSFGRIPLDTGWSLIFQWVFRWLMSLQFSFRIRTEQNLGCWQNSLMCDLCGVVWQEGSRHHHIHVCSLGCRSTCLMPSIHCDLMEVQLSHSLLVSADILGVVN